jgi:hypothetical protein
MKKTTKKILISLVVLAALGIGATFVIADKYNFLGDSTKGYIEIENFQSGMKVFIDNESVKASSLNTSIPVEPGLRDVIVSRDGYWPWFKQIQVDPVRVTVISPFIIKKVAEIAEIEKTSDEYSKLFSLVGYPSPTKEKPVVSSNNNVAAWISDRNIYVKWLPDPNPPQYFCREKCSDTLLVFSSEDDIRNLNFYPGRHDVLLLSVKNGVYAVEIDKTSVQNFEPVFLGESPVFAIDSDNIIIVDSGKLLRVEI